MDKRCANLILSDSRSRSSGHCEPLISNIADRSKTDGSPPSLRATRLRRCDVPCPPANHATGRGAVPTLTFGGVFFGEFDDEIIDDVDEFRVVGFGDEAEVGSVE